MLLLEYATYASWEKSFTDQKPVNVGGWRLVHAYELLMVAYPEPLEPNWRAVLRRIM
jgi:hypothetical protein